MTTTDRAGYALSGANDTSLDAFEQAAHELRCLMDDPVTTIDRAIAASPEMPMAHVLKAWLHLLGTEPAALAVARECVANAQRLPATDREQRHVQAAGLVAAGHWRDGGRALEDLSAAYPRDALALQAGHQVDFFTGDSRMLRDRVARVLPSWSRGVPGYHAVLGMHAFGLEETGDYAQAERQGRMSVELEPRDSWGWHAVTHVMEMRNAPHDGIAWLEPNSTVWSQGSFLAVHNWWHLALFHLELDDVAEVLRLYDQSIGGPGSGVVLDMVDQSALLWRLQLRGVDVGSRWSALAERWAPIAAAGNYAFNDLHAMMAFAMSGRDQEQQLLLEAQRAVLASAGDNADFTREVGHAATRAVQAFVAGDFAQALRLLRPIRSYAHRFGGSHAQRDVIDLTLIESAWRAGAQALHAALANERVALRPQSLLARRLVGRAQDAPRQHVPPLPASAG
jgi:hypothetical protein